MNWQAGGAGQPGWLRWARAAPKHCERDRRFLVFDSALPYQAQASLVQICEKSKGGRSFATAPGRERIVATAPGARRRGSIMWQVPINVMCLSHTVPPVVTGAHKKSFPVGLRPPRPPQMVGRCRGLRRPVFGVMSKISQDQHV